jgi:hypothetical protein
MASIAAAFAWGSSKHPSVKTVSDALAEGLGQALVRARNETVDGHRHVARDLRHRFPPA